MLEISISALFLLLTAVTSFSLYLSLMRLYPENKFSLYFWTHLFSYAFFTIFIVIYEFYIEHEHVQAVHELVTTITLTNVPFYIIEAAITIAGIIILKELMSISKPGAATAFVQINVLFSAIGFYLLGDQTSFNSFIGLFIICCGAMIAGMKRFSFNIFKDYDPKIFKLGLIYALLQTARVLITYICTAKMNIVTQDILHTLTRHLHVIPFATLTPLHFNIGVQCITVLALFTYTAYYLKKPESIINGITKHYKIVLLLSSLFTMFGFLYFTLFGMIENKDLIVGTIKLYVPFSIFLGYYFFQKKPSKQVIIGVAIIICGSLYTILV